LRFLAAPWRLNHQTDNFLLVPAYAGGKTCRSDFWNFWQTLLRVEVEVFQLGQQGDVLQRHCFPLADSVALVEHEAGFMFNAELSVSAFQWTVTFPAFHMEY
jgi:hypothetical protein